MYMLHVLGFSSRWITLSILSNLVWFPWWLRHGAMGPFEGTPLWETLHRLDFRIDTLNMVIHLRKCETVGLISILTLSLDVLNSLPPCLASIFTDERDHRWKPWNPPFSQSCSSYRQWHMTEQGDRTCPLVGGPTTILQWEQRAIF